VHLLRDHSAAAPGRAGTRPAVSDAGRQQPSPGDSRRPEHARRIALFGDFGSSNLGNEAALRAILYHVRRRRPDTELVCICTHPRVAAATHHVRAVPVARSPLGGWVPRSVAAMVLRKICRVFLVLALEPYNWLKAFAVIRRAEMLIVPGTGLLTDAHGVLGAGPYNLAKWTLMARATGCRVIFVSVGAGPVDRRVSRFFVKLALGLAATRSYRDDSSKLFMEGVGIGADTDRVSPDLAFSLPLPPRSTTVSTGGRPIVGLGIMESPGGYGDPGTSGSGHQAYIDALVAFAAWLIDHGYGVRVLLGDYETDVGTKQQFIERLREAAPSAVRHVIDEPATSVDQFLSQIASTKLVVSTRFHGAVLSFVCGKPTICISFHEKCSALMRAMGMDDYCLPMSGFTVDQLIDAFRHLEAEAPLLTALIQDRTSAFRSALDEQYEQIAPVRVATHPATFDTRVGEGADSTS
jgi:polysaccharide pyruvyl transferase WcaK-like protein